MARIPKGQPGAGQFVSSTPATPTPATTPSPTPTPRRRTPASTPDPLLAMTTPAATPATPTPASTTAPQTSWRGWLGGVSSSLYDNIVVRPVYNHVLKPMGGFVKKHSQGITSLAAVGAIVTAGYLGVNRLYDIVNDDYKINGTIEQFVDKNGDGKPDDLDGDGKPDDPVIVYDFSYAENRGTHTLNLKVKDGEPEYEFVDDSNAVGINRGSPVEPDYASLKLEEVSLKNKRGEFVYNRDDADKLVYSDPGSLKDRSLKHRVFDNGEMVYVAVIQVLRAYEEKNLAELVGRLGNTGDGTVLKIKSVKKK